MEDIAPGFRFYPTEEELVSFYLHHKLEMEREDLNRLMDRVIPIVNIYEFNPWDLPQFSVYLCHKDPEQWFFFIPRQESEARGGKPKRRTTTGYWKATGSPGVKRTMVFYKGRAPNGIKTEWKMNEYKAIEQGASSISATPTLRHEFSLCRVYKKSKCLRSFDRRPPVGGVQIIKPNAAAHQGEATAGEAASGYHKSQQMAGSPESSSSEDHGNPSQTGASNDSSATVFNYDELFWNLDGFWESQIL
ncbi:hypothetical protein ES319_A04G075100v1 [Gossypium barbadense]|uniref:NAC domain-containing protein n=2 Tax=Gossypium TaxID=3633 RepID=A0A5J5W4D7_GOSBA|nr:hypothetical protein ES319_A04G075100v1 [Gossypium barbadense]TYH21925.1 hypothetical protein ES288_A04G085100v1 [Gossypium darwinii]